MCLNYDGAAPCVADDSVRATSSDAKAVSSYTIIGASGQVQLFLFDRTTQSQSASVEIVGGVDASAQLFRFDGATRLGPAGSAAVTQGRFTVTLPAYSATLAVIH